MQNATLVLSVVLGQHRSQLAQVHFSAQAITVIGDPAQLRLLALDMPIQRGAY